MPKRQQHTTQRVRRVKFTDRRVAAMKQMLLTGALSTVLLPAATPGFRHNVRKLLLSSSASCWATQPNDVAANIAITTNLKDRFISMVLSLIKSEVRITNLANNGKKSTPDSRGLYRER